MEIVNVIYAGAGKVEQDYSVKDRSLIQSNFINSSFGDTNDKMEVFIYDVNDNLIDAVYDFKDYVPYQTINSETNKFDRLLIDPVKDGKARGFDRGSFNIQYNFFKNLFNSSDTIRYWIRDISPSRTELRLSSQTISDTSILNGFNQYQAYISLKNYFSDFYLNLGNNELIIAINAAIESDDSGTYLLVKLYEPLPFDYDIKTQLWIVDKLSDSVSYNVDIEIEAEPNADQISLRGPNFNVKVNEKSTQTTPYYSYASLISSPVTSSFRQLSSYYQDKAVSINVDFTNFENFVHFSSATERVNNFVYKLNLIENYTEQVSEQSTIIGSGNVNSISSSITILQDSISNIIENFDIYEYYLYYASESFAWPKSNSGIPYQNVSVTSSLASNWLGSPSTLPSQNTSSILYSASFYDDTNKDILRGSIPQFILDDSNNVPYVTFMDMMGQHFDNIWVYYKDVSNRYNATNSPKTGISLDIVSDALKGMGFQLYTNTNVSNNVYYDLFGYNEDGSTLPPTGSETITNYVTSSIQTGSLGSKQTQQEIYKRLYHNLPYLYKTKGTQRAIKAIISIYGIPENILTVNEFGSYNRNSIDGVDSINNEKITVSTSSLLISSSVLSPSTTIQYYSNDNRSNSTNIEVGFSIADVLNSNITSSLGYFNIDQLIGNPNDQYSQSYAPLISASDAYFSSYTYPHSVWEYIRLIKYFNNSLFKTIKDFVPARANLSTGIIVKSHILERNKYARHEPSASIDQLSQSIDMIEIYGEPGNLIEGSTAWSENLITILGEVPYSSSQNVEKLTGEFGGSEIVVTNGEAISQLEASSTTLGTLQFVNLGATYQNVSSSVRSKRFFDLDYNSDQLVPVNLGVITQSISNSISDNYNTYTNPNNPYAQLQDYNYAARHFTDPRYYGSKVESATYNVYTNGDKSYGKTAAIDKIKYQYAYLVDIYSASLFLPNRSNAQIKYLIDNNQNVLDLTKVNTNIFNVQNVYKSGENVDVSLFKYDEKNPYSQQLANNPTLKIYEGGFRYLPMLHNIGPTTASQAFYLTKLATSTTDQSAGGGGSADDANYTNPLNWNLFWWSVEYITDPGTPPACTSDYIFSVSASYVGPSLIGTPSYGLTLSARTGFNASFVDCSAYPEKNIEIIISPGATQGSSATIDTLIGISCTGASSGGSVYGGSNWPFSMPNCAITDLSVTARGSGGGGTGASTSFTTYTTYISSSQPCVYFLSQSNELVFNATMSFYFNNYGITFDSTTDPAYAGSGLDTVVTPLTISPGDKFSFYNAQSLGWDELFEYTVKGSRMTGSLGSLTGSRLLVELDSSINLALLNSGSTVPTESFTGAPFRTCRYIFWKHIPDETNVMLRYNPKDSRIVEEGLLFPQYISEQDKLNSGNTVKALRSQNLLPPSP
jgi:hypothetical protein